MIWKLSLHGRLQLQQQLCHLRLAVVHEKYICRGGMLSSVIIRICRTLCHAQPMFLSSVAACCTRPVQLPSCDRGVVWRRKE